MEMIARHRGPDASGPVLRDAPLLGARAPVVPGTWHRTCLSQPPPHHAPGLRAAPLRQSPLAPVPRARPIARAADVMPDAARAPKRRSDSSGPASSYPLDCPLASHPIFDYKSMIKNQR